MRLLMKTMKTTLLAGMAIGILLALQGTAAFAQTVTGFLPGGGSITSFISTTTDFEMIITGGAITNSDAATVSFLGNWTGSLYLGGSDGAVDLLQVSGTPDTSTYASIQHTSQPHPGVDVGDGAVFNYSFLAPLDDSGTEVNAVKVHSPHQDVYNTQLTYTSTGLQIDSYQLKVTGKHVAAPEPATFGLFMPGLFAIGGILRRRGRKN